MNTVWWTQYFIGGLGFRSFWN